MLRAKHHYQTLIDLFNHCFALDYNTRLIKGEAEPIYLPQDENTSHHSIIFAHGFFSSALHECAHWFIAGAQRRQLVDYGYWYAPDGRTAEQQQVFEAVEVKPQALEWILSIAADYPRFRISVDNLNGESTDPEPFKQAVYQQVKQYLQTGLPARAEKFRLALSEYYGTKQQLDITHFNPAMI